MYLSIHHAAHTVSAVLGAVPVYTTARDVKAVALGHLALAVDLPTSHVPLLTGKSLASQVPIWVIVCFVWRSSGEGGEESMARKNGELVIGETRVESTALTQPLISHTLVHWMNEHYGREGRVGD
jgi:hypothetical protein